MIIKTPVSILTFCSSAQRRMTLWQKKVIPRMIVSILMSFGNPNYSRIAEKVLSETRHRSSVARFFNSLRFNPDLTLLSAIEAFLASFPNQRKGIWFLILDGTATRRGGFTKIGNAIKYREKKEHHKGGYPSKKAHMFLMGILLAPDGTRFVLPQLPYYTKEYCRENAIVFKTQVELAAQMITQAPVPRGVKKVVVLADEYYEGETVHRVCELKKYSYIMPTDSRRCLADEQGRRTAVTLHARGRHLQRDLFSQIHLVEGQEKTAPYRRLSEPGRKNKRVYRAYTEDTAVAGLGMVRTTYSWKKKKKKERRTGGDTYKVLISNDLTLSVEEIVEYYELRWQIELFFRELKSSIGFNKFKGNSFKAFNRFVSLVLLSFLYLEWTRVEDMTKTKCKKQKAEIARLRTTGLIMRLEKEIDQENIRHIMDCFGKKGNRLNATILLKKMLRFT